MYINISRGTVQGQNKRRRKKKVFGMHAWPKQSCTTVYDGKSFLVSKTCWGAFKSSWLPHNHPSIKYPFFLPGSSSLHFQQPTEKRQFVGFYTYLPIVYIEILRSIFYIPKEKTVFQSSYTLLGIAPIWIFAPNLANHFICFD